MSIWIFSQQNMEFFFFLLRSLRKLFCRTLWPTNAHLQIFYGDSGVIYLRVPSSGFSPHTLYLAAHSIFFPFQKARGTDFFRLNFWWLKISPGLDGGWLGPFYYIGRNFLFVRRTLHCQISSETTYLIYGCVALLDTKFFYTK